MSKSKLSQKLLSNGDGSDNLSSDSSESFIIMPSIHQTNSSEISRSHSSSSQKLKSDILQQYQSKQRYKFLTKGQQRACNILIITFFLVAFILSFLLRKPNFPVLFITFHSGNIMAYNAKTTNSKISQIITTDLLKLNSAETNDIQRQNGIQFRQMYILNNDHLIVANGDDNFTFISSWECNQDHDQWKLTDYFADNITNLIHPYGVQWYSKQEWYIITTQVTSYVFILNKSHQIIKQIPIISAAENVSNSNKGLRSVAVDDTLDLMFIASPETQNILIFDILNGFNNSYNITLPTDWNTNDEIEPISIVLEQNVAYITDRMNDKIFAFTYNKNSYSLKWISTYCSYLKNPTGLTIDDTGNHLFVISQGNNKILVYDTNNGIFQSEFTSWSSSNNGEQLIFVDAYSQCALT